MTNLGFVSKECMVLAKLVQKAVGEGDKVNFTNKQSMRSAKQGSSIVRQKGMQVPYFLIHKESLSRKIKKHAFAIQKEQALLGLLTAHKSGEGSATVFANRALRQQLREYFFTFRKFRKDRSTQGTGKKHKMVPIHPSLLIGEILKGSSEEELWHEILKLRAQERSPLAVIDLKIKI